MARRQAEDQISQRNVANPGNDFASHRMVQVFSVCGTTGTWLSGNCSGHTEAQEESTGKDEVTVA